MGVDHIATLARTLKPRYHFAGLEVCWTIATRKKQFFRIQIARSRKVLPSESPPISRNWFELMIGYTSVHQWYRAAHVPTLDSLNWHWRIPTPLTSPKNKSYAVPVGCLQGVFYERPPYRNTAVLSREKSPVTRFIAIADQGNTAKQKVQCAVQA